VVSRDPNFAAPGVLAAPSLDAAFAAARGDALRRQSGAIIVAGGGDIYEQALPLATQLAVTFVHKTIDGDARFPAIDPKVWRETAREAHQPQPNDDAPFTFVSYERAVNAA
jgi:dihydrofolate reductase